jgi:hypothetical protein
MPSGGSGGIGSGAAIVVLGTGSVVVDVVEVDAGALEVVAPSPVGPMHTPR